VNVIVEAVLHLVVDLRDEPRQAAERRLHMAAGAAEAVVEIEMTEGGIEIVIVHQQNDASAEPDAFGIAGRAAIERLGGLDELVGLALVLFGNFGRVGGLLLLILAVIVVIALRGYAGHAEQHGERRGGKMAQNRKLKLKHASTHIFPDVLPCRRPVADALGMPTKWVSNAAKSYVAPSYSVPNIP
jgi:hypothetical protein